MRAAFGLGLGSLGEMGVGEGEGEGEGEGGGEEGEREGGDVDWSCVSFLQRTVGGCFRYEGREMMPWRAEKKNREARGAVLLTGAALGGMIFPDGVTVQPLGRSG